MKSSLVLILWRRLVSPLPACSSLWLSAMAKHSSGDVCLVIALMWSSLMVGTWHISHPFMVSLRSYLQLRDEYGCYGAMQEWMLIMHVDSSWVVTSTCSFLLVHGCMSRLTIFSVWGLTCVAIIKKVSLPLYISAKFRQENSHHFQVFITVNQSSHLHWKPLVTASNSSPPTVNQKSAEMTDLCQHHQDRVSHKSVIQHNCLMSCVVL